MALLFSHSTKCPKYQKQIQKALSNQYNLQEKCTSNYRKYYKKLQETEEKHTYTASINKLNKTREKILCFIHFTQKSRIFDQPAENTSTNLQETIFRFTRG